MPSDRAPIQALKNLLTETDLLISTTEPLPENRTPRCRELLKAALALTDDLLKQSGKPAAAIMGHKGGTAVPLKCRSEVQRIGKEVSKGVAPPAPMEKPGCGPGFPNLWG